MREKGFGRETGMHGLGIRESRVGGRGVRPGGLTFGFPFWEPLLPRCALYGNYTAGQQAVLLSCGSVRCRHVKQQHGT